MNLAHLIDHHPAEQPALITRDGTFTYGELRDRVAAVRGGLQRAGVGRGDRVLLACTNDEFLVTMYLATLGVGAVAVPVNPTSPAPELLREVHMVEPAAVVLDAVSCPTWPSVPTAESIRAVIVSDGEVASRSGLGAEAITFADLLDTPPVPIVEVEPDEVAVMLFTSGTAGAPRAAMLTHHNLRSNIDQSLAAPQHTEADDVVFGVLPMFHIFGLNVMVGLTLAAGAALVLEVRFDPAESAALIARHGVTVIPGAPPLWAALAQLDALPDDALATVRIAVSGASRLPVEVAQRVEARFGVAIAEGYGLTETAPVVTSSSATGLSPRFGSVGCAIPGVEIRLVNDEGREVPVGDAGEILVRGPNVFAGYFRDPDATARVLRDGWLHTGDVGMVDDDGWLYLVDRAKDLIIVSGFNVYPAEVEEVLAAHPEVAEAGVVGVEHPETGEAIRAYVVPIPGAQLTADALVDFACLHLARYKCPREVHFVDELPRNLSGKLVRRHLDDTVLDDTVLDDTTL